jgi:hypothetical protein
MFRAVLLLITRRIDSGSLQDPRSCQQPLTLYEYITMHGKQNIKSVSVVTAEVIQSPPRSLQ